MFPTRFYFQLALSLLVLSFSGRCVHADPTDIIFNEILYNASPDNTGGEFIEFFNRGEIAIDLGGWSVEDAVEYTFPQGIFLNPVSFIVIARNLSEASSFYGVPIVGEYTGRLDNAGETVVLRDNNGVLRDYVTYGDSQPWPSEADGGGPSLELFDPFSDNSLPGNWGVGQDYTPGAPNNPAFPGAGPIVISEIMYKPQREEPRQRYDRVNNQPYTEEGDDEWGEYIELFNRNNSTIDLSGWSFTDGIQYTFPPGTELASHQYLVIAASPEVIEQRYHPQYLTGPWDGKLDNGGERITLRSAPPNSIIVDSIRYDDEYPWTIGPDEYGHALECIDVNRDNGTPANWRSSQTPLNSAGSIGSGVIQDNLETFPIGNGTPGDTNSVATNGVPPLVADIAFAPTQPTSLDTVTVTALVTDASPIVEVSLETFLGISTSSTIYPMYDDGGHGDAGAGDGIYGVQVPPRPSQTLVHFRIIAEDMEGSSTSFPYEGDPSPTFAYYHFDDEITTGLTQYHLWIPQSSINALEANIWTEEYQDCSLVIDHIAYPHIGVHYRGRASRSHPKRQYQFRFNRNQLYNGNRSLDTMLARPDVQKIAYDIIDLAGLQNLVSDLIRLHINGPFHGVYVAFESPNSAWLDKYGHDPDGEIYKARVCETLNQQYNSDLFKNGYSTDLEYWGVWGKPIRPLEAPVRIREFVDKINNLQDTDLLPWLDSNVDLDQWFTFWGLRIAMNVDDFLCHNYYLYLPGHQGGKWRQLLNDFDSFGRMAYLRPHYGDGLGGDNPDWQRNMFYRRVTDNPTLSRLYHLSLRKLLTESFREDLIFPIIDSWFSQTAQDRLDENAMWGTMLTETNSIKSLITTQRNNLLAFLSGLNLPGEDDVPDISPSGGTYDFPVVVTISTPCVAYYTLDGSDPRLSSTSRVYQGPISITRTSTLTVAGLCDASVLPTLTPVPGQDPPWDASNQFSLAHNPNGVWRYEDGNGNLLTTTSTQWNLPDFPLGNPGWLGPPGLIHAGWAVSNGHHGGEVATPASPPKDWPQGSMGTHSPTYLTWTSPISGTISVLGSFWKMRDWITPSGAYSGNGSPRPCPVTILKNSSVIAGPYTLTETSSAPGKTSSNPAVLQAQTPIAIGDKIRIKVDGIDFVGFQLTISPLVNIRKKSPNPIIQPSSGAWTDLITTHYQITGSQTPSNVNNWRIYPR